MMGLPLGCLHCCLLAHKVAYFVYAELDKEFRQLSTNLLVNIADSRLPSLATFPSQATLGCLEGCLPRERAR